MAVDDFSFLVPVERRNLKELAYEQLRTGLIRGQFSPGSAFTVRGVAEALGISPMPVRAALERLEAEGALVARDGNRTLAVPELTLETYQELREIRVLVEGAATERAAANVTQSELSALEQAAQSMQRAADSADLDGYLTFNWQFHFSVYRSSRMPILVDMIESLWLRVGVYVRWMMPDAESLRRSMPNHWALTKALKSRDPVAARLALTADIMDSSAHLFDNLSRKESLVGPESSHEAKR